jgi:lipid-binding SYLF domain-containing protein
MKEDSINRALLSAAAALAMGGFVSAGPAMAQAVNANSTTANSTDSSSAQQLVNDATQIVQKINADSRLDTMLKQSKGVFIMPDVVQGAFIVGGKGAQGALLKHNSDGFWSNPVFLTIGSVSVGAQVGGKSGPAAMILMTDKALNDFTQANNFSLNINAGLTVINYSAKRQAPVGKGDIAVWSDQSGAFAGVNVSGGDVNQNTTEDHAYYGKQVDATQILSSAVSNPHADKLTDALPA